MILPAIRISAPLADFTPAGARRVRVVTLRGPFGPVRRIRWYVAGSIFRQMLCSADSVRLSRAWVSAGSAR